LMCKRILMKHEAKVTMKPHWN